ncbi:MAG: LURP-one-related family protein [Tissierellia bacterium]|nr:LURP-one-related family protein [Tissierellia bacterium]
MYKLFIKQKVLKLVDHYFVMDENGQEVYEVSQDFMLIGNSVNVKSLKGRTSFTIERGFTFLLPSYDVNFEDGRNIKIEQEFSLIRTRLSLNSRDYDLEIKGDIFAYDFSIYNKDVEVGHIDRKIIAWGDTFVLDIYDEDYEEEILAIAIAVDEIIDRR